jgi:2-polyprenyl-3-methyl-5-hydroxy-6-metoxy-1,4-benzoquinol methylase
MKIKFVLLIQGSSKNWGGGQSLCMNEIDGTRVIVYTINRIIQNDILNKFKIIIIAPEYDNGNLNFIKEEVNQSIEIHYGENDSPLKRMISATKYYNDNDYIIRIDALNFCLDIETLISMINQVLEKKLDLIKFIDNWPPVFTADIYKIKTLRKISKDIPTPNAFHIHPKFYILKDVNYNSYKIQPGKYSETSLKMYREKAKYVYEERELGSSNNSVKSGDMLSFHYSLALDYLNKNDIVLDIACGLGFGTNIVSEKCKKIIGADINTESIFYAKSQFPNLSFRIEDCTKTTFEDGYFDKILSFETIEHVNPNQYFIELKRILKINGYLILSTPQNAIGDIPINPFHHIEYDLNTLLTMAEKYFKIINVVGIKQGTIIFENDPIGTNTFLVLKKEDE